LTREWDASAVIRIRFQFDWYCALWSRRGSLSLRALIFHVWSVHALRIRILFRTKSWDKILTPETKAVHDCEPDLEAIVLFRISRIEPSHYRIVRARVHSFTKLLTRVMHVTIVKRLTNKVAISYLSMFDISFKTGIIFTLREKNDCNYHNLII